MVFCELRFLLDQLSSSLQQPAMKDAFFCIASIHLKLNLISQTNGSYNVIVCSVAVPNNNKVFSSNTNAFTLSVWLQTDTQY